jgi:hypothetical protein
MSIEFDAFQAVPLPCGGALSGISVQVDKTDVVDTHERRLHMHLATKTRVVIYVHAGVVIWRGGAVVMPGRSYAGKSTLVHALVQAGAGYFSDEYAIIDQSGLVHPFPRPISLRDGKETRRINAASLGYLPPASALPVRAVLIGRYLSGSQWSPVSATSGEAVLDFSPTRSRPNPSHSSPLSA